MKTCRWSKTRAGLKLRGERIHRNLPHPATDTRRSPYPVRRGSGPTTHPRSLPRHLPEEPRHPRQTTSQTSTTTTEKTFNPHLPKIETTSTEQNLIPTTEQQTMSSNTPPTTAMTSAPLNTENRPPTTDPHHRSTSRTEEHPQTPLHPTPTQKNSPPQDNTEVKRREKNTDPRLSTRVNLTTIPYRETFTDKSRRRRPRSSDPRT